MNRHNQRQSIRLDQWLVNYLNQMQKQNIKNSWNENGHVPAFLDLKAAASHTGLTLRWLRRHWTKLLREGVSIYRLPTPKDPDKGKIMFDAVSLVAWIEKTRVVMPNSVSPQTKHLKAVGQK